MRRGEVSGSGRYRDVVEVLDDGLKGALDLDWCIMTATKEML